MNKLFPLILVTLFIAIMLGCGKAPEQKADPYNLKLDQAQTELDLVE